MKKILTIFIVMVISIFIISVVYMGVKKLNSENNDNEIISEMKLEDYEFWEEVDNKSYKVIREEDIVLPGRMLGDLSIDISDKEIKDRITPEIFIGTIQEGIWPTNYNPKKNVYTMVATRGKIKVEYVLKGEINQEIVDFVRQGGDITFAEYEEGLREVQRNKMELSKTLTQEEKENKYVESYMKDDIRVEEGKRYLIYAAYDEDYEAYNIGFNEYGLREIKKVDGEIRVLNNHTNEWELLSDVTTYCK